MTLVMCRAPCNMSAPSEVREPEGWPSHRPHPQPLPRNIDINQSWNRSECAVISGQKHVCPDHPTHTLPKICVVKVANLKSCMLLAKLSCGMGHNSYGEAAWPNDIVYIFAVLIYGLGVLIFGLSIACPLEIMSCSNAFSTPLEIVPEWYLLLCFNLLRIVTSKGIGVKEMVILVPIIICLCIIENVSVYSNPFRRAIMVCVTLVYSIFAIWLSVGSLVRIDKALPLLWIDLFSLRSHACEPHVAGHEEVMACYVPKRAKRSGECASKKKSRTRSTITYAPEA